MPSFQKAIAEPPSPYLQMTPPDSPPRELSLRNTDKDDLKQVDVNVIKQALSRRLLRLPLRLETPSHLVRAGRRSF